MTLNLPGDKVIHTFIAIIDSSQLIFTLYIVLSVDLRERQIVETIDCRLKKASKFNTPQVQIYYLHHIDY